MTSEMTSLLARYENALMNTFGSPALALDHGEGVYVWDIDGNRYLDLLAGIAVNALGYAHPAHIEAVTTQVAKLTHSSNFFATVPQVELAEAIMAMCEEEGIGSTRVFFTNSGTESNEAALKLARLHKPGGKTLALTHSFHGRTLGSLSVTHKPVIREPFEPLPGPVSFVEPTVEALREAIDDTVAALILEPIQGEAGVLPLSSDVLIAARELTQLHGALLIVDEVQTGIGRTGRWFDSTQFIAPDVVTLAKGLGGGVPIGACVARSEVAELFTPGAHGSTYAGNALACAYALATVREVATLRDHVTEVGAWLKSELVACGFDVRGRGLLIGIEVKDAPVLALRLRERGVIVNAPNSTTIRLAPPLIITTQQLAPFIEILQEETRC